MATFKWTFLPFAVFLGSMGLALLLHSIWIVAVGFIVVRLVWMFVGPRFIPMDVYLPSPKH